LGYHVVRRKLRSKVQNDSIQRYVLEIRAGGLRKIALKRQVPWHALSLSKRISSSLIFILFIIIHNARNYEGLREMMNDCLINYFCVFYVFHKAAKPRSKAKAKVDRCPCPEEGPKVAAEGKVRAAPKPKASRSTEEQGHMSVMDWPTPKMVVNYE
jgi:hypothetical protein